MIKPTTYDRIIQPTKFGIARQPTLKDLYSVWEQLNQQNFISLRPISVDVIGRNERVRKYVTEDNSEKITNLDDFLIVSQIPEFGNLPVKDNSAIYFESPDSKYLGALSAGEVTFKTNNRRLGLPELESFGSICIAYITLKAGGNEWYLIPVVAAFLDGLRRYYNLNSPYLSVVIGSPDDKALTFLKSKKEHERFLREIKRLQDRIDVSTEIIGTEDSDLESLLNRGGTTSSKTYLTYTSEDLQKFLQFVEHIKKINTN